MKNNKIIDLITKPGFRISLEVIDIAPVMRDATYDGKNTGEKVSACRAGKYCGYGD